MPQVQMKPSYVPMTISCDHCLQEQIVHMQAKTGFWQMAHQSVKCVRCEKHFDVMIPTQSSPGRSFRLNYLHDRCAIVRQLQISNGCEGPVQAGLLF